MSLNLFLRSEQNLIFILFIFFSIFFYLQDVVSTPTSARTAKIPPRHSRTTPRRKPLIDLNETFVSGSDAGMYI